MPIYIFIPYLLSVFATITNNMATNLTDIFSLNSEVTWTLKFQGQMINCLYLKNAWSDLHETKAEWTRTTRTPAFWAYPPPPHDYPYHWDILDPKSKDDKVKVTNLKNSPKFQIFEFWNGHYTRHTSWSCLIRCANMKWIRWVLLKIQSGHDSVHRRTDGQGDTSIPPYQLRWSGGYNKLVDLFDLDHWLCLWPWVIRKKVQEYVIK